MPKPQSNKRDENENLPTITKLRITLSRAAWERAGVRTKRFRDSKGW
jgi:hypothetical protein